MNETALNGLSVPAFNAIRFLLLSVIIIPLFEAAGSRLFRIACALHILRGRSAVWQESGFGYLTMHGKYYSRSSKLCLYFTSVIALSLYLLLEYGTSARSTYASIRVQVRNTTLLKRGSYRDLKDREFVNEEVDIGATLEFLRASLFLQGQRSVLYNSSAISSSQDIGSQVPRPWAGQNVGNATDFCFNSDTRLLNSTLQEELLNKSYSEDGNYLYTMEVAYNMSSLYHKMHLLQNGSVLFEPDAEEGAPIFKSQLFSIRRDARVEGGVYFDLGGSHLSEDKFVSMFGSKGMRTTLWRPLQKFWMYMGYMSLAENKLFRCVLQNSGSGNAICRMALIQKSDGTVDMPSLIQDGGRQWGPKCRAQESVSKRGKCLFVFLRGKTVSSSPYQHDVMNDDSDMLIDVLLIHVLGTVEFEGDCSNDEFVDMFSSKDTGFSDLLREETAVSLDEMRRMMTWPVVSSAFGKGFLKNNFTTTPVPGSVSVVPTVDYVFLGVVSALVLVILLERVFMLLLKVMERYETVLPRWAKLLVKSRQLQIRSTFCYASQKLREGLKGCEHCYSCNAGEKEAKLHLQKQELNYYLALSDETSDVWDGHSPIAGVV